MKSFASGSEKRRPDLRAKSRRLDPEPETGPLISCLMVSRGNVFPAQLAIECYRRQTYKNRELVIVCAQKDSGVSTLVSILNDPTIRYIECSPRPLGELRNLSVKEARGSLLCTWDDDDLYHPQRLERQEQDLGPEQAASFLSRLLLWWPERQLLGITSQRPWENSMLIRREALPKYPALQMGEDSHVLAKIERRYRHVLSDRPDMYCYVIHSDNTCGVAHFESLFEEAEWIYSDYERELSYLSSTFPLRWYADELCAQSTGGDGISKEKDGIPRSLYLRRTFGSENVVVDARHFRGCVFNGTTLMYQGGRMPIFENCDLGNAKIEFVGSASNALRFERQLRSDGFLGDG